MCPSGSKEATGISTSHFIERPINRPHGCKDARWLTSHLSMQAWWAEPWWVHLSAVPIGEWMPPASMGREWLLGLSGCRVIATLGCSCHRAKFRWILSIKAEGRFCTRPSKGGYSQMESRVLAKASNELHNRPADMLCCGRPSPGV